MSWTRVQANSNNFASSSSARNLAYGSNVTSGNLLVVVATQSGTALNPSISDTLGNTWQQGNASAGSLSVTMFSCIAGSSGANTVTITPNGANAIGIATLEYNSSTGTPSADGTPTSNSGTGSTFSAGSVSVGGTGELIVAGFAAVSGSNGSGANGFSLATQSDSASNVSVYVVDKFPESAADTPQCTIMQSVIYVGSGASFKPTSGGGGGSGTPVPAVIARPFESPSDPIFAE